MDSQTHGNSRGASSKAPSGEQARRPLKHDIFQDPALDLALTEDPLFKVLSKWWRQILVVAAAVGCGWYAYTKFSETAELRRSESSDLYFSMKSRFDEFARITDELTNEKKKAGSSPAKDANAQSSSSTPSTNTAELEKKRDEARVKLLEALSAMSDAQPPYDEIGRLYRGLLEQRAGNQEAALRELASGEPLASAGHEARLMQSMPLLVQELKALARARVLLDAPVLNDPVNDRTKLTEARAALVQLAKSAQFVNVGAALTLRRISSSAEERREAEELIAGLEAAHPEQGEALRAALTGRP